MGISRFFVENFNIVDDNLPFIMSFEKEVSRSIQY